MDRSALVIIALCFIPPQFASASVFNETFSGTGDHASLGIQVDGFEVPDWYLSGTDTPSFNGDGLKLECITHGPDLISSINFRRPIEVDHGIIERVELRGVDLADAQGIRHAISSVWLAQTFDIVSNSSAMSIGVFDRENTPNGKWSLEVKNGDNRETALVPQGTDIAFEIRFIRGNGKVSTLELVYFPDIDDVTSQVRIGPSFYEGNFAAAQLSRLSLTVVGLPQVQATLDEWSIHRYSGLPGDFDGDDVLSVNDLHLLTLEFKATGRVFLFDANADGMVDREDLRFWIHELRKTFYGDANLDGEFNSADLVEIFAEGKYEDGISTNALWESGDWNADWEFDSSDLVVAFQDGGYEQGPKQAVVVPEAVSLPLVLLSGLACLRRRE